MELTKIREQERQSHIAAYTQNTLYQEGSWLKKPVKTVMELLPLFQDRSAMRVLDLGCGVGRNAIAVASRFSPIPCRIDCVDILDLAIEMLSWYAHEYQVSDSIHGIVSPIDAFEIEPDCYDLILAVSALEHMDSEASLIRKLYEIRNGTKENGLVCLIMNASVKEYHSATGEEIPAQFEVNLPVAVLQELLLSVFSGWNILKQTCVSQTYSIPRDGFISEVHTNVVTLVAKK